MSNGQLGIGDKIAERYEVREVLGKGTLGTAYKVVDNQRSRQAVLKLLPNPFYKKKTLCRRFLEHYRARQQADLKGLAKVFDLGMDDGIPYVVHEFLEGLSLSRLMEAREEEGTPFEFAEVESIAEEAGQILAALHQTGFHGGLKPENVFLMPDGIKITDEGLLEVLPPEVFARVQIKLEHAAPYLAPEILSNPKDVSHETDIFGLAAIAYALLAENPPSIPPEPIEGVVESVPAGIDDVFARGLADVPTERYPTINTFLLDLARLSDDSHKVAVLEQVVEAEAAAAAQQAMEAAEGADAGESEPETESSTEIESPASAPDDEAASKLFEDDEIPATAEPEAPTEGVAIGQIGVPGEPVAADQRTETEREDLLTPPPSIGKIGGARKIFFGLILLLVAATVGAGVLVQQGVVELPAEVKALLGKQTEKESVDPKLKAAVESAIASAEEQKEKIDAVVDREMRKSKPYLAAVELIQSARASLKQGDLGTALESAQNADRQLGQLLDRIEEEERERAAAKAKQEARDEKQAAKAEPSKPQRSSRTKSKPQKVAAASKPKGCPPGMIEIPGGTFMAGSPPDDFLRDASERSLERISVDAYCIDKYEYPNKKGARPRVGVDQASASTLCDKAGKRLCSELEWEKACKGPRNYDFPYGKAWDPNRCNTETATGEDRNLAPIGRFNQCASDYGVVDLSGNVMEWTSTRFEQNAAVRIVKGGSYMRPDYAARCAYRYTTPAKTSDAEIGFRCCTDLN